MAKSKLNTLKEQVIHILEICPEARDSDDKLYVEICKANDQKINNCSFEDFMLHRNLYNVPSYSSVERVRRKAQEEREDLAGSVREMRKNLEQEYVDFALN